MDIADKLGDKVYSPREYMEHMLNLPEEEKELRRVFFEKQFADYNARKAAKTE